MKGNVILKNVVLLQIYLNINTVFAGLAPTWGSCGCYWGSWDPWSQCTRSCGGGRRYRTRLVWHKDVPECDGFEKCASNDMGSEYTACNNICYNGGTYQGWSCSCVMGWYGSCCSNQIRCGHPGNLTNGNVHGSSHTYGKSVTYTCNHNYQLTGGDTTRTCQTLYSWSTSGIWSGSKPRCAFIASCNSNPCQNGGTCINGLDSYSCQCSSSYTGINCEYDIQPPVVKSCPGQMNIFSSNALTPVNWTSPTFVDPVNKPIQVSTNYPEDSWTFPWGEYIAQYTALKPSNGLRTECRFNVSVLPVPCQLLNIPEHGAKVCNGWKQKYGQFCLVFCGGNYSLSLQYEYEQWYVCGASGVWIENGPMPNCTDIITTGPTVSQHPQYRFSDCSDIEEKRRIQSSYLEILKKSQFRYFCDNYSTLCTEENVSVEC